MFVATLLCLSYLDHILPLEEYKTCAHETTDQVYDTTDIIMYCGLAIYAYVILKDEVKDNEEVIIKDLKAAITRHIGSFAVPHSFMVS